MYFEGLTQGQVAARLGVPLGTVKTRAARAHRRLRVVLDAHVATG
jgi:DNA-directed RNA polymerase specialized sigma24 family protein